MSIKLPTPPIISIKNFIDFQTMWRRYSNSILQTTSTEYSDYWPVVNNQIMQIVQTHFVENVRGNFPWHYVFELLFNYRLLEMERYENLVYFKRNKDLYKEIADVRYVEITFIKY